MITYNDSGYQYFYDRSVGSWTIYQVDNEGNQIGHADYHARKDQLKANYPMLKFQKEEKKAKPEDHSLTWRVHVPNLLKEILNNKGTSILAAPLSILGRKLYELGEIANRINDPELNAMMCELTIYSIADPESEDHDPDLVAELREAAKTIKKQRSNGE